VAVTGVVGTSALGTVTQTTSNTVPITGLVATTAIGSSSATGGATASVTGVSGTCETNGFTLVWGLVDTSQTPNWKDIAA